MRILVLVTDAFGGHGGIAKFNRDLLTALCTYPDCSEVVAIPRLMPNSPEPFPAKLTYVTEGLNSQLQYIATVFKILSTNSHFDLIVCGHINLLPLAYLVKLFIQKPLVLILYGIEIWQPSKNFVTNYLISKIDTYISVSQFTKEKFLKWTKAGHITNFILPGCVDLNQFSPGPKKADLIQKYKLSNKTVLITVARLSADERRKGVNEVMETVPILLRDGIDVVYLVVGDGTDRSRLEKKVVSLGLSSKVIFTGFVNENEKIDYYRLADIFIMPSRGDGFGIVFLEAMACGLPVIGSKVDGSQEALLGGKLGLLVDPAKPEEIVDAIKKALKTTRGFVPQELKNFSLEVFRTRVWSIIDKLAIQNTKST